MFSKLRFIPKSINPNSNEYDAYLFVRNLSTLGIVSITFFAFFNLFYVHNIPVAIAEFITVVGFIFINIDLIKNVNIKRSSYLFVIFLALLLFFYSLFADKSEYALVWNILPVISMLYLFGEKRGATFAAIYLSIIITYILSITPEILSIRSSINLLLNFTVVSFGIFFYEKSRQKMLQNVKYLVEIKERQKNELLILSQTDALTKIANRLKLDQVLEHEFQRAQRYKTPLTLIFIDIDYFKNVNDLHGHQAGDLVLQEFSQLIKNSIRATDTFGRWGGEEFLLILPETTSTQAFILAKQLCQSVEQYQFSYDFSNTASFGVNSLHQDNSLKNLIKGADKALYQAKEEGRNRVVLLK